MSLLDDVSIVVTPNGYKAGTLYGVLPTYAEGIDLVDNGDFATDLSGWDITGNDATHTVTWTASGARFQSDTTSPVMEFKQLNLLTSGKQYVLTCNIAYTGVGQLRVNVGTNLTPFTEGANTKYFTATSSTMSFLRENANVDAIIDNVIVKEVTSSDMDVTRATAATRVDEDGLVNYAEVIGEEEIEDGNFPTGTTAWYLGTGWSLGNGYAESDGTNAPLEQYNALEIGKQYIVVITVTGMTASPLSVRLGTSSSNQVLQLTSDGTYTAYGTAGNTTFRLRSQGFNGKVTNVSVKEVTRDNVPRIDYTGGGCPHILAEPERTNLIPYSEDFTQWTTVGSPTLTPDYGLSPDGTESSTRIEFPNNARIYTSLNASGDITFSVYLKGSGVITLRDNTNVYRQDVTLSSEWERYDLYFNATITNVQIQNQTASAVDCELWGAQTEVGSYGTSYIPNFGTAAGVTRNQDIFTRDGIGSLINSTEGVLFVEMAALADDGVAKYLTMNDGSSNNDVRIYFNTTSNGISALLKSTTGQTQAFLSYTVTDTTEFHKIAFVYAVNRFELWIDGEKRAEDLSGIAPVNLTTLEFSRASNFLPLFAKVKQLQVYTTALSPTQLAALTS